MYKIRFVFLDILHSVLMSCSIKCDIRGTGTGFADKNYKLTVQNYFAGTRLLVITFFKNAADPFAERSFNGLVMFTENTPNFILEIEMELFCA